MKKNCVFLTRSILLKTNISLLSYSIAWKWCEKKKQTILQPSSTSRFWTKAYETKFTLSQKCLYIYLQSWGFRRRNVSPESNSSTRVNKPFRLQNREHCKKGCQGNVNSTLLGKGIMAQPQIPEPYPGFPVLLSDPSLSSVQKPPCGAVH